MVLSTQRSPDRESACVVPPGSASRTEFGNSVRTSRLPVNGVAASSVSSTSNTLATWPPLIRTGVLGLAGQYRQGALNHALPQVSNGEAAYAVQLSFAHFCQLSGHCTSVHWTAL